MYMYIETGINNSVICVLGLPKSRLLQMLRDLATQANRIGGEQARGVGQEAESIVSMVRRFFIDNFSRRKREVTRDEGEE